MIALFEVELSREVTERGPVVEMRFACVKFIFASIYFVPEALWECEEWN